MLKLGLRIGEVVALKWSDIDWLTFEIHIQRMEGKSNNKNGDLRPLIHEYTKKKSPYGNRYLPLSDYEISLFQRVKDMNSIIKVYHLKSLAST